MEKRAEVRVAALATDREVSRLAARLAAQTTAGLIAIEWNGAAVTRIADERPSIFLCRSGPQALDIAHALRLLVNTEYCGDVVDAQLKGDELTAQLEDGTSRTLTLPCLLGVTVPDQSVT
ncbi:MAG: hypothetical protein JO104_03460 [Candidatus Eremiobacteraeota bacterium]|nr:hypothetical protein [Candidatus Eremiobacteraeota bacterium]